MKILLLAISICCSTFAFSQDIIFKRTGEELYAKVLKVGILSITFKKADNPDGPEYTIDKADVFMVKYANGQKDIFDLPIVGVVASNKRKHNSLFGELGGNSLLLSINYERLVYFRNTSNFVSFKIGICPFIVLNIVNFTPSINVGQGRHFLEVGAGIGFVSFSSDTRFSYPYFTPIIGYRMMSPKGFLFKPFVTICTIRYQYKSSDVNGSFRDEYNTIYFPFLGLSLGYSF